MKEQKKFSPLIQSLFFSSFLTSRSNMHHLSLGRLPRRTLPTLAHVAARSLTADGYLHKVRAARGVEWIGEEGRRLRSLVTWAMRALSLFPFFLFLFLFSSSLSPFSLFLFVIQGTLTPPPLDADPHTVLPRLAAALAHPQTQQDPGPSEKEKE